MRSTTLAGQLRSLLPVFGCQFTKYVRDRPHLNVGVLGTPPRNNIR